MPSKKNGFWQSLQVGIGATAANSHFVRSATIRQSEMLQDSQTAGMRSRTAAWQAPANVS